MENYYYMEELYKARNELNKMCAEYDIEPDSDRGKSILLTIDVINKEIDHMNHIKNL